MALTTYTGLKAEIADWIHRSDLTSYLDTFIDLTEEMFTHEPRSPDDPDIGGLRVEITTGTGTLSTSVSTLARPTRFLSAYRLDLTGTTGGMVQYVAPDQMPLVFREGSGKPRYWTVSNVVEFDVIPDSAYAYELKYYAAVAPLSGSVADNAILLGYPMCYLAGCLHHAFEFVGDTENSNKWLARYKAYAWGANQQFQGSRYTQGALQARPA